MTQAVQLIPVILCGGSGTRLWPLSRAGFPKQFLALSGKESLFQQAVMRVQRLAGSTIQMSKAIIVTNEEHRFLALDQWREIAWSGAKPAVELLLEPIGKNTAPALTLAALAAAASNPNANDPNADPILLVAPADQTVQDVDAYAHAMEKAVELARGGSLVVLGITPTRAETGYGYIRRGSHEIALGAYTVSQFTEKPDRDTAKAYLTSGDYFWNGGMFVVKASVWLNAINQFHPEIANASKAAWQGHTIDVTSGGETFVRPGEESFLAIPSDSIDYAVVEKCPGSDISLAMVPLEAGWNDLGSWDAVWQVGKADAQGNVIQGDALVLDTKNSLVCASTRLVTLLGVHDLVVVETADAVLVTSRDQAQNVKAIVSQLDEQGRDEKNLHRKVNRPWGWYDSVDEGERFKVKRIQVKPGASLSLQMHHHRAEHWVVVKGIAEITNGTEVITLTENQSTFIPQGQTHRLANPGTEPLEIIEVQSGNYLGEDDIVRFEDTYGRT